jgi:hypothetical protein
MKYLSEIIYNKEKLAVLVALKIREGPKNPPELLNERANPEIANNLQ